MTLFYNIFVVIATKIILFYAKANGATCVINCCPSGEVAKLAAEPITDAMIPTIIVKIPRSIKKTNHPVDLIANLKIIPIIINTTPRINIIIPKLIFIYLKINNLSFYIMYDI